MAKFLCIQTNSHNDISTVRHFFQVCSKHAFIPLEDHTFSAYLGSCFPLVVDTDPAEEILPSLYGSPPECSVHIVFLGEWCFITGLAVFFALFCKAVCQEDETDELDVWLVKYCPVFHWCFHLAFFAFPVPMVSFHFHLTLYCFLAFLAEASFWQDIIFL